MKYEILDEIKAKIEEADLVLIGIGERVAVPTRLMDQDERYIKLLEQNSDAEYYPFFQQVFIKENQSEYVEFYNRLFELIEDKNYYVITTNVDDVIYQSKINADRVVAPCGSIHQFVCDECKGKIEYFAEEDVLRNQNLLEICAVSELSVKKCPNCGKIMKPNVVSYEYYDENGYLENWARYTKWLQGTVNKKLCILELGVGLNYPTVIRWPNERIVTYNNKAYMYRVHEKLFQLSEGIGERAKSVPENPMTII